MNELPILVVEDEPDGQELVSRLLAQVNIKVDVTDSAEDAWQRIYNNAYSALIIDLALPGKDGFELLREVRQNNMTIPCIAITAFHTPELKQRALEEGFDAYFAKPLDRTRFIGGVEDAIRTR
jgi:DNA-binding response OmpR family regulator